MARTASKKMDMDDLPTLRDALIEATLPHIAFDGWAAQALRHGAADLELPPEAVERAFPGGAADAVAHFIAKADREMLDALDKMDLPSMKVRDRIATAIRVRLEQAADHKEAVRKALAFTALPQYAGLALKSLYRTVDAIWYAAGDTATDYNFYTKRALLAGVYSATLLYWLEDKSEGHEATWAFLDRRIANVMSIPKLTGKLRGVAGKLPNPFLLFRGPKGGRRGPFRPAA